MDNIIIRNAASTDAEEITLLHIESWKTTYRGIFPDEWLDKSPETISKNIDWRIKSIAEHEKSGWPEVVAEIDGKIVGWAFGGINSNAEFPFEADLTAVYLLKEYQNIGIGKLLIKSFADLVVKNNLKSMLVWAIEENINAIKFYKKLGGQPIGKTLFMDKYPELGFGWNDVGVLLS